MKKTQQDIENLLNPKFIASFFKEKLPSDLKRLPWSQVKIRSVKKRISKCFYHLVIKYELPGNLRIRPVFCISHSYEPRRSAFSALKYIWAHSFARGKYLVPRPLLYSLKFKALFYQGLEGVSLFSLLDRDISQLKKGVRLAAGFLAKLHKTDLEGARNFNIRNSAIVKIFRGFSWVEKQTLKLCPELLDPLKEIFDYIAPQEKSLLKNLSRSLIHGDFHPVNIILSSSQREQVMIIDFTDVSLGDPARDVGSFLQQLEYTMKRLNSLNVKEMPLLEKIFLASYLKKRRIVLSQDFQNRINFYKAWTALRSAVFSITKPRPTFREAKKLIKSAKQYLSLYKSRL